MIYPTRITSYYTLILSRFQERLFPRMGPACYRRFVDHVENYINAFVKEAEYREKNVVLDMASYEILRRENSAVRCCFGLFGYVLGLDLPDEIFEHPDMMAMHLAAVDMVCWSNVRDFLISFPMTSPHRSYCSRTFIPTIWSKLWGIPLTT